MTRFGFVAAVALLAAGAASAQTTVIERKETTGTTGTVVTAPSSDTTVVNRTEERSVGCETKHVEKTNDEGDRVSKTKTNC
jgi:alpha/beta superfamily hydrolase